LAHFIGEEIMTQRTEELKNEMEEDKRASFKILDKLEQRISTLEKVIGKLQLRLGDVVLYIDKKEEQS
jgi:hypothetical protein